MKIIICNDFYVMTNIDEQKELKNFANLVKTHRVAKGVTQQDAYNDTGIHFARIEQGKRNINYLTLVKICNYFDKSLHDFFKQLKQN